MSKHGTTKEEIFVYYEELKANYGKEADKLPLGAVDIYSASEKIRVGLQQLMAGARKWRVDLMSRCGLAALTKECTMVTGIDYIMDAYREEALAIIDAFSHDGRSRLPSNWRTQPPAGRLLTFCHIRTPDVTGLQRDHDRRARGEAIARLAPRLGELSYASTNLKLGVSEEPCRTWRRQGGEEAWPVMKLLYYIYMTHSMAQARQMADLLRAWNAKLFPPQNLDEDWEAAPPSPAGPAAPPAATPQASTPSPSPVEAVSTLASPLHPV